jgi:CheY-like chemotaxis protein
MLTSRCQRGDAVRAKQIGFSHYLTKPVKHLQLLNSLLTVLGVVSDKTDSHPSAEFENGEFVQGILDKEQKKRIRILLAEDNVVNQRLAVRMLEKSGYRADTVSNGKEAVEVLKSIPYDLVLMDVNMPEMDGFEATRIIRDPNSKCRNHHIPIIAITAHAMQGDREKCLALGMNDYISKPVQREELFKAIERIYLKKLVRTSLDDSQNLETKPNQKSSQLAHITDTNQQDVPDLNAHDIFDKEKLLEGIDHDEEFCKEMLDIYIQDTTEKLERLREAIKNEDAFNIEQDAHSVKGSSANIFAYEMQRVAYEMEKAGKTNNMNFARNLMTELEHQFEVFRKIIPNRFEV